MSWPPSRRRTRDEPCPRCKAEPGANCRTTKTSRIRYPVLTHHAGERAYRRHMIPTEETPT